MTIQSVGALLRLQFPLQGKVRCPFEDHEDKIPSFEIKEPGNRWRCYGCGRFGGAIDLVKTVLGMNFLEAKRWLAKQVTMQDVNTPRYPNHSSRTGPGIRTTKSHPYSAETPPDHEVYEELLQHSPLRLSGREYLLERGLSVKTISAFRVGQIGDRREALKLLIRSYGYERVAASGLLTKNSSREFNRLLFPEHSLLFPFLEETRVSYLQTRQFSDGRYHTKWLNLNLRKLRLYNSDALHETQRKPIAVCEGVIDTLSAIELGYSAFGLVGVNATLGKHQISLLRGKSVNILLDWDPAGEKRAARLQQQMSQFGITATRKNKPSAHANDVNEYLVELRCMDGRI